MPEDGRKGRGAQKGFFKMTMTENAIRRAESGLGSTECPDRDRRTPFFLFGLGNRSKLIYRGGTLTRCSDGEVIWRGEALGEEILAADYRVRIRTAAGWVCISEDEEGVSLTDERGERTELSRSPVRLPSFAAHPFRDAMRILHHDVLVNICRGKPLPNFFVYDRPWYRDGAMMAMVLERTGNLSLIAGWARGLGELYDRNNAGVEESDNLGQLLYLLAVTGNRSHPLIPRAVEEAGRRMTDGALTGLSDFAEHPVYQTKWLKYGMEALGLDTGSIRIPDVRDDYGGLFWMDGHREPYDGAYDENYPYLSWARAHTAGFAMDEAHLDALRCPVYLISHETAASQAKYEALRPFLPAYADAGTAAPHTWHASEMFLYLDDFAREGNRQSR